MSKKTKILFFCRKEGVDIWRAGRRMTLCPRKVSEADVAVFRGGAYDYLGTWAAAKDQIDYGGAVQSTLV